MKGFQQQQLNLLKLVHRYVTVEPWALAQALDIKESQARNRADRLKKRQMLERVRTLDGHAYRLTKNALELFTESAPPDTNSDLAVLRFVYLSGERRKRYIPADLDEFFCHFSIPDALRAYPYCCDLEQNRISCLLVPEGSDKAAIAKLEADVFTFENTRVVAPGRDGAFRLVVLTTDPIRASAIRAGLSNSKMIPLEFETVPDKPTEPARQ